MLWVVTPCCHTLKSIARQCVAQGLQHMPKQGLQQGLRQNLARGGETGQGGPFQRKPFWPKNVPGKTSQRKRFWPKKRSRRPKGKPLNKFWCGNNTFLVPGPFSPPKRKTSERRSFWHKNVFFWCLENHEIDQIWNALGKGSGDSNLAEHHWWGTHGLNAAICFGPCKTFRGKLSKLANRSEVKGYRHQKYSMFCKLWYQCNQHMVHYAMSI